jgi:hypothetical protein
MTSSAVNSAASAGDGTAVIVSPSISTSAGCGPVGLTTVPFLMSVRTRSPFSNGGGFIGNGKYYGRVRSA